MTVVWQSWDTERGRARPAAALRPPRRGPRRIVLIASIALLGAFGSADRARAAEARAGADAKAGGEAKAGAEPAAGAPAGAATTPADLARRLEKAESILAKAEGAMQGRDPGRVSLLLKRVDDELGAFEVNARLAALVSAVDLARKGALHSDLPTSLAMMQRARVLYPPLSDYAVLQQAEESSRAAVRAAESGDADICVAAIDRFDAALRPALLLKRLGEAREAVARARTAMVRNDMKGGAAQLKAARQAIDGLRMVGALSRALFSLRVGAELLDQQARMAARDQVQKALRGLRSAADLGGQTSDAADLASVRDQVAEIWRRVLRPQKGDAGLLLEAARRVEAIRQRQS